MSPGAAMSSGDRACLIALAVRLQHVSATAGLLADAPSTSTEMSAALDGIASTIEEQTTILNDIIRTAE